MKRSFQRKGSQYTDWKRCSISRLRKGRFCLDTYNFHNMKLAWLDGGVNFLDGGTMFGVVPKALWSRKYEVDENNLIELRTDPIYISYEGKHILIDSGIGKGKLSDKLKRNLGVRAETKVEDSLA